MTILKSVLATKDKEFAKGAKGAPVRLIQQALRDAGAELVVDGVFGQITETAVKRFQISHLLTADGIVGPVTGAALDAVLKSPEIPEEADTEPGDSVLKAAPWLSDVRACTGIKEFPGGANNPAIMAWREDIAEAFPKMKNYAYLYTGDAIPWCGFGLAGSMARCGIAPPFGPEPTDRFLSARSWAKWGKQCDLVTGAIAVFSRSGGGHVAVVEDFDGRTIWIRGYNQSDTVNVVRRPKDRSFLAARWPSGFDIPRKQLAGVITNAAPQGSEA